MAKSKLHHRVLGLVIFFVIAVAPGVSSQTSSTAPEGSVLAVLAVDPGAGKFIKRATAFHIGDGVFFTNAHVVRGAPLPANFTEMYLAGTTAARVRDAWMGPISVSCVNAKWHGDGDGDRAYPFDVARVTVPQGSLLPPGLTVSPKWPELGAHVTIMGFAAASHAWPPKLYTATGHISSVNDSAQTFVIDVEAGFALEGSSGSPVLNSSNEVIGILYARQGTRDRSAADKVAAVWASAMLASCK